MNQDLDLAAQLLVKKNVIEDLEAQLSEVNGRRDDLGKLAKDIAAQLDAERAAESALIKISALPVGEREALRQALLPQGVSSDEVFGQV